MFEGDIELLETITAAATRGDDSASNPWRFCKQNKRQTLAADQHRIVADKSGGVEGVRGHVAGKIAGLDYLSMLSFPETCLIPINDFHWTLHAGAVRDLEADCVLARREARDVHDIVFEGRFKLQAVQASIGLSDPIRCDRETQLDAMGPVQADVFSVESFFSEQSLKRTGS